MVFSDAHCGAPGTRDWRAPTPAVSRRILLLLLCSLAGCASLPPGSQRDPRDHLERFNRGMFKLNTALDHAVMRPVARGYVRVTPAPVRSGVANFLVNLAYTTTIANDALQGHLGDFGKDLARLAVNTTLGIGGILDPATRLCLARHDRDFGQTMGQWGVATGSYVVLPLLGPSDMRDALGTVADRFTSADGYITTSLRGLANTLSLTVQGVSAGRASPEGLRTPVRELAGALVGLRQGEPAFFSWRTLISGKAPTGRGLRHIILVEPALDYSRLQPGQLSVAAIRATARRLHLDGAHGVRVRVTGQVALADDEFATLTQGAGLIAGLAGGAIILMLWLAVRTPWLIVSILVTMATGLLVATALGLILFHQFNLISVAFIPLFVGMGMDLGIQFSVRYRAERCAGWDVYQALIATARVMGSSLTLAAAAIGLGFLAFAPTVYYGVSQLGVIAGVGLFAALALNLTLLPALISLGPVPGERARPTYAWLTRLDHSLSVQRKLVVAIGVAAAMTGAALLPGCTSTSIPCTFATLTPSPPPP